MKDAEQRAEYFSDDVKEQYADCSSAEKPAPIEREQQAK